MRLTLGNGGHYLCRRIGKREPQRQLFLRGKLSHEVDVEAGQLAIGTGEVDDGAGTNQDDQLLYPSRRGQRPRSANARERSANAQVKCEPDRDGKTGNDQNAAARRAHCLLDDDGGNGKQNVNATDYSDPSRARLSASRVAAARSIGCRIRSNGR